MRGIETRPFDTSSLGRLAQFRLLAGALVVALVLVLVGQWGLGPAAASTPGIVSVAPTGATTAGGGTITITGSGFGAETPAVTIGGTAATGVVLVDDTTVTATIPPGAQGLADVTVTPVGGSALTLFSGFEYRAPAVVPVFDTIAPASGPTTGGDPVTISGANLDRVNEVRFGGVSIPSWQFVNLGGGGSSLTVIAPYGNLGAVDITLISSGVSDVTKYSAYQYVAPQVSAVSPASGPSVGGTNVTITGSGFGTSGGVSVSIGGASATNVTRVDSTRITATTPAGAVGAANVVVTVSGSAGSPGPIVITGTSLFTYAASVWSPTLSAITPNSGPLTGGQTVTLTGTNFRASDASLATVTFGGVAATVQSVATNGKSMTVTVPAHAAGAVDVQVTTVDGRATMRNGFTYNPPPTISAVSPATGIQQGGTTVTLTGTGFGATGVPTVTVGGRSALCVARVNDTTITFVTPSSLVLGARDVEVTPATRGGSVIATGGFTYVAATTSPTISSVDPAGGLTSGGTAITLTGSGFQTGMTPSVLIGGSCATNVVVVSDSTITANTPTGVAGARDVVVTTATGTVTATAAYTYADAPAILSLSPSSGPTTGGAVVTINGRGFGSSGTPTVTIDGVAVASVERLSDTQIRITTPPGTPGGKAVQVTPAGGATLNKPSAYTYQAPTVTGVQPFAGPTRGGTPVTITGTGFGETGTPTVTFGGVAATSVVRVSSTQLTAVTPAGTAGYVAVTVTPTTGSSSGTKANAFSYVTDVVTPQITSSIPSRGPSEGGTTVYVTGHNFIGTNSVPATVTVGGVAATHVTVAEDGESLTFRAPALSPGVYDLVVTTNEGSATLRWAYYVAAPPIVDGCGAVSPREILPSGGQSVTVNGEGFGASGTPSVTVGGIPATVTASSDGSVTFVAPEGDLGYPQIVVRPTTGGSPITVSGCLFRTTDLTITAPTHTIDFGDPSPVFVSTASGLWGDDELESVVHVFTGSGYGPTTVVPTNAGYYTVTPASAVLNPGTLSYYDVHYVSATFHIRGLEATVRADEEVKVYGDDDPEFSVEVTGLAEGHELTGMSYVFSGRDGTVYGPTSTPPVTVGEYWITPASALVGGAEANYSFTYVSAEYEITPRPITISAVPAFKVYGDSDPAFEWHVDAGSLAYDDTLYGALERDPGEDVGEYDILQGSVDDSNYLITYVSDVLEITPRPIDIVIDDAEKEYGDADPAFTASADGLQFSDVIDGYAAREPGENVGEYEIQIGTLSAGSNYTVASVTNGTFTITPRPLEITIDDADKIYGDEDPEFGYTITSGSLVGVDEIDGAASRQSGEDVGTYGLGQGTLDAGSNYTITFTQGTFTIDPRPIEVTAVDRTKAYGDEDPSPFGYTVTAGELIGDDVLTGALGRDEGEAVGDYPITPGTLGAGPNYEVTVVGGTLTITPREITVTADDVSRTYGDADPALTWQITDGELVFDDTLGGELTREPGEDAGDYAIQQGSLTHDSYDITFVEGTLTIDPKPITVRADAATKEFGESDPMLTAASDDLVFEDTLTGSLTREPGEDVGDYAILAGTIGAGPNYTITSFSGATLTITPRAIELTAQDRSAAYGEALPSNAVELTTGALVPGDALGSATYAYDPATPVDAGTYSIIPSAVTFTSGSAGNYDIRYVPGTLTIDPLTIAVTIDNATKEYGDADPAFTYDTTPALVGDDVFSGSVARDSGESVGAYAIRQGTLDAGPNYVLDVTDGELTITTREITVTADAAEKVYGDPDPALGYTVTAGSLLPGDELTGSLEREAGEDVGSRAISQGTLDNGNYAITFEGASLTITPRELSVTIDDASKQYGTDDPELTATADGLVDGDSLSGSPERDPGEAVATYTIRLGSLTAGDNYEIVHTAFGAFEITQQSLVIRADDASIVYGDPLPAFGYSIVEGTLVDGDTLESATASVDGTPTDAGGYDITVADAVISGGASNYDISYEPGTLTISPLTISVSADPATKEYGDPDPAFTFTTSPDLLGDDTFSGGLTREGTEDVGTHPITQGSLSAGSNYTIEYSGADLSITVRSLTITADPQSKIYGDSDPELTYAITGGSLLPGDVLTGSLERETGEDVGARAITQGTLDNGNYDIVFLSDDLTIEPRPITIIIEDATKQYGDDDPEFTAGSTDLVFDDTLTGSVVRESGESVGEYDIREGSLFAGPNYTIDSVEWGTLTITVRSLTITADDATITYGDTPLYGYTITSGSLADGDAIDSVDYTGDGSLDAGTHPITPSAAVFSTGSASNYDIDYAGGTLTVDPLTITVTATSTSKEYGDPDPVFGYSAEPDLLGADVFSGALSRDAGETVGAYALTLGTLDAGTNYTLEFVPGTLDIEPRALEITAEPAEKTYGDADPAFTWTVTGGSLLGEDTLSGELGRDAGEDVGDYDLTVGSVGNPDYEISFVPAVLTVTPRTLDIVIDDAGKTYGDDDPAFVASSDDLVGDDELSGAAQRDVGEDVGVYEIGVGTLDAGPNYELGAVSEGAFEITPRPLEVTADDEAITFGDTLPTGTWTITDGTLVGDDTLDAVTITPEPASPSDAGSYPLGASDATFGGTAAGNYDVAYVPGTLTIDPLEVVVTAQAATKEYGATDPAFEYTAEPELLGSDAFTGALSREAGEAVGEHALTLGSLDAGDNYALSFEPADLTIQARAITVTADDADKVYGDDDPAFDWTITEGSLVGDDVLAGALGRTTGEDVGDYPLTLGTLGNANYDIEFVTADLTITPKPITVTAVDTGKEYGGTDPELEADAAGLVGDDVLTGAPTRVAGESVNEYDILQGSVSAGPNYTIESYVAGTFTISAREIEVTATDDTITYGEADPAFAYSITSGALVGDDAFTGTLTREAGADAGEYDILQGSLALPDDYELTFVPGTLTIEPRVIGITADSVTKTYGDADPTPLTFTVTSGELADGDEVAGALTREPGEGVGTYDITPGTLDAGTNYTFTVEGGTLTIEPREIQVTADNTTAVYGDEDPEFTWSVTSGSLVGEDVLAGGPERESGDDVGDYDILIGTLANANYDIEFVAGLHVITPRPVTVVGDDVEIVYGASDPILSATATGLMSGDELAGAPVREPGDDVGTYQVLQGTLAVGPNYELTEFTPGTFTIIQRSLDVTPVATGKTFGQPDPALEYTISRGSLVGDDEFSGALERTAGEDVGTYDIGAGTLSLGDNYVLTVLPGSFDIDPAELTITVGSGYTAWGEAQPEFTLTPSGLVDGDSITSSTLLFDGSAVAPALPGTYEVSVELGETALGAGSNYLVTVVPGLWIIDGPYAVAIDPPSGLTTGGMPFEIRGSGFGFDAPTVLFDGLPATEVVLLDSGTIIGLTPEHAVGVVTVTVETTSGTVELVDAYEYVEPIPGPAVLSIEPGRGPVDGGTSFTVTGDHLLGTDGEPAVVLIDGRVVTDVVVAEDGLSLTGLSPAGTLGAKDVDVLTADGWVTFFLGFTYYAGPAGDMSGDLWLDLDLDGVWDEGEPAIPGVTVNLARADVVDGALDPASVLIIQDTTDASGHYLVGSLPYGLWNLGFDSAGELELTGREPVSLTGSINQFAELESPALAVDFPLAGPAHIENALVQYADGRPAAGVTVTLRWAGFDGELGTDDDVTVTLVTGPDGTFDVSGLPSGPFEVSGVDAHGATFGPVPLELEGDLPLTGAVYELGDAPVQPQGLAATGLDLGHLALTALVLLLLGAVVVGRAGRMGRSERTPR